MDVSHSWQAMHSEWDTGKMDGVYTTDGTNAMGYYNGSDLPYYYWLAQNFTLCGNYFCYQLGPTLPNRLALWTGTCGGNTTNNVQGGQLNWPTIVDVLDEYSITWKCYNLGLGTGSQPTAAEGYNALAFFQKWIVDPRLYYQEIDYYNDLKTGTLPQVSFLITESIISEHPPADIHTISQPNVEHRDGESSSRNEGAQDHQQEP
jgi:phospholipase C